VTLAHHTGFPPRCKLYMGICHRPAEKVAFHSAYGIGSSRGERPGGRADAANQPPYRYIRVSHHIVGP